MDIPVVDNAGYYEGLDGEPDEPVATAETAE